MIPASTVRIMFSVSILFVAMKSTRGPIDSVKPRFAGSSYPGADHDTFALEMFIGSRRSDLNQYRDDRTFGDAQ
jgi:hypothetical protein